MAERIETMVPGNVWKVLVKPGDKVEVDGEPIKNSSGKAIYIAFNSSGFHATFTSSVPQGATFPGKFKLCATNPSTTNNTRISMSLTTN